MTADAAPPYIAAAGGAQQVLTPPPQGGLKVAMTEPSPLTKAEIAAAARAARKAAEEAAALRVNLHRRKAQSRAGANPGQSFDEASQTMEEVMKCR